MTDFANDHELAAWAATAAGELLLEVRARGLEGRELKDAGDMAAHEHLMKVLAEHRPGDAVLSEEAHRGTVSALDRHTTDRVWIIDPLDGTREFSEPPREDWAVHVALWARSPSGAGELIAGAVALPGARGHLRHRPAPRRTPVDGEASAPGRLPHPTTRLRQGARGEDRR